MANQKFTEEEVQQVQQVQQNAAMIFRNIGQLHFQKNALDVQIAQMEENHEKLIEQESQLIEQLRNKYGEGSLDLNSFEFIPDETKNS